MITLLSKILAGLPIKGRIKEYELWKGWDRLVGPQVAMNCRPEMIKDGILFLKVGSNVWMQQLQFMKTLIIEKVNGHMGDKTVRDVRFRIGKIEHVRKAEGKPWKEVTVARETLKKIEGDLTDVEDAELRNILKRLRIKEAQAKYWKAQRSKGASSASNPS